MMVLVILGDPDAPSPATAPNNIPSSGPEVPPTQREPGQRAPISPGVFERYTRAGFQKTFDAWGEAGVTRIQNLREAAADQIAENPRCDRVALSELSASKSTPPNKPVVFVDCANGERFYLSERDLGAPVASQQEKSNKMSAIDLIEACTEATISRLNFPSTFDKSLFTTSSRQAPTTGNWVVTFDFTAKNSYGMELPSTARCIATPDGQLEVSVHNR